MSSYIRLFSGSAAVRAELTPGRPSPGQGVNSSRSGQSNCIQEVWDVDCLGYRVSTIKQCLTDKKLHEVTVVTAYITFTSLEYLGSAGVGGLLIICYLSSFLPFFHVYAERFQAKISG